MICEACMAICNIFNPRAQWPSKHPDNSMRTHRCRHIICSVRVSLLWFRLTAIKIIGSIFDSGCSWSKITSRLISLTVNIADQTNDQLVLCLTWRITECSMSFSKKMYHSGRGASLAISYHYRLVAPQRLLSESPLQICWICFEEELRASRLQKLIELAKILQQLFSVIKVTEINCRWDAFEYESV